MKPDSPSPKGTPVALVTGGAGFIGSHLVDLLLARGWRVRVLDNFATGRRGNLPSDASALEVITGDIRDEAVVAAACAGATAVFHLAALVSVQECIHSPGLAEEINIRGTERIFTAATRAGVRRVVFSSSCALYGSAASGVQHEGLPAAPASPYAATKLAGERLAAAHGNAGTAIVCLRYFNVYGPRQRAESDYAAVIPRFIAAARHGRPPTIYGDGNQTRDFIFVGDVARANFQAATHGAMPVPAVFNVGTGQAVSVNGLWRLIARDFSGTPEPVYLAGRPGEVRFSQADVSRARDHLGFSNTTPLADGLHATVATLRHAPASP